MKLIAFRVTMYKGIIDSGWVDVNDLTVLVGKNESGKTSLLRALHKLNPYNPDSDGQDLDLYEQDPDLYKDKPDAYQMDWEWPRAHRHKQDEYQVVCLARFRLSDQEKSEFAQITGQEEIPDTIEVSRNYGGQLKINWEENISHNKLSSSDIDNAFNLLPEIREEFGNQFKDMAYECLKEARHFADEGSFMKIAELAQTHEGALRAAISSSSPPMEFEDDFIMRYVSELGNIVQTLEAMPSTRSKLRKYVVTQLPTFIYMDDYRTFSGTAQLDEVHSRRNNGDLTEEDRTFLAILSLSRLDLDLLIRLGQGSAEESRVRQHEVDAGSNTLTQLITNVLPQRNYAVDYRLDGQLLFTRIKDNVDSSPIELEERSKGFQWFFSFELMFLHESEGTFKNCVILLDEPGLHLHPSAQKKLLSRLQHYAQENTLLYTTHLPFMIDLNQPDQIRVLEETPNGIDVTTDFTKTHPEAKLVFQAALGMDASQSFLVAKRNLVVEGVDDYWVLTELSNLLRQDGGEGLPEDIFITPAGGASTAVHIATIMIGQKLDVITLFDSDQAGKDARDKLVKEWITRYPESQTEVILLGDAVEINDDCALEDLFSEQFITDIVKEAYNKQLAIAGVNEIHLQGTGILWKRIENFMKGQGIKINKGPIATRLRKKLSSMESACELPEGTEDKAIKLFQAIRSAFGEESPKSV